MVHGYDVLMLLRTDPDWAVDRSEVQFLDRRSDGIIFASPIIGESKKTFEALIRHKIPAVVCYRRDLPKEIIWVDVDNRGAMRNAVQHMIQMGHTRIAQLSESDNFSFDNHERRRHFTAAIREFGLHDYAENIILTPYFQAAATLVNKILGADATAVVAMNDLLAIDLKNAVTKMGLNVPNDLSIIGGMVSLPKRTI